MSYQITIQPQQRQFQVDDQQTILSAALKQGYSFPYGCRSGNCGTCKAKLLSGRIVYHDKNMPGLEKIKVEAGEILLCQAYAESDILLEVREIERISTLEIKRLPCRVAKMHLLTHDVMQVFIQLPNHENLVFCAGQYIDFLLQNGRHRSFSIANSPSQTNLLELHIRRVKNGYFTEHVFTKMREKDILRLEGPLGTFFLRHDNSLPVILVAGGTGFAPIQSMIEQAIEQKLPRPMRLYWGVKAKRDLYRDNLAQQWAKQYAHIHYIPVLSEPQPGDEWIGRKGWVHEAVLQDVSDLAGYEVYASGPPEMIQTAQRDFLKQGLSAAHFFSDTFTYATDN